MRLHNVYLISEKVLKQRSLVTEPTLGVYIKPSIECAQKIGLVGVIGTCLLEKLQILVTTKNEQETGYLIDEPEYIHYKDLLTEQITDYLCYSTMSYMVMNAREKFRNAGIVNTIDNNYQQPTFKDEILYTKRYFDDLAQYYATRLREAILAHLDWYKEYNACDKCNDKSGKLDNTYHCGIVL